MTNVNIEVSNKESKRNFSTKPNYLKVESFLTKEEFIQLKKSWSNELKSTNWTCHRWNMIYTLLRGKSIADAFTPITNVEKLKDIQDPWIFVDYRLDLFINETNKLKSMTDRAKSIYLETWFKPWVGILSEDLLITLCEKLENSKKML